MMGRWLGSVLVDVVGLQGCLVQANKNDPVTHCVSAFVAEGYAWVAFQQGHTLKGGESRAGTA